MLPRNQFAVSRDLSCSTAMLISLKLRVSHAYASDPLPYFQIERAHDIRPRAALHAAMSAHRILYAGDDTDLPARLRDGLRGLDCFVVRSPVDSTRTLIRSDIKYSPLLFDKTGAGAELESYARSISHLEHTSVIIVKKSEGLGRLLGAIRRRVS